MREDFKIFKNDIIYFDNAATTFKPKVVLDEIIKYYESYTSNAHRGDYDISYKVNSLFEKSRENAKKFINAKEKEEIIFTKNTTDSLNLIINNFFKYNLKENDEVLITKAEHASNILPWYELRKEKSIKINYINLNKNYELTLENVKSAITDNTKVISIAHITNVIGDERPIKEIIKYAHEKNILVVIDGAQSVPHKKINVQEMDIDFLAFSAHKMCGPTGVGVLYAKKRYLEKFKIQTFGGGMNSKFNNQIIEYKELPYRLEAGTPNIEGVLAFSKAIEYIEKIDMKNISELRKYAIDKLKKLDNIKIYNEFVSDNIIIFNVKDVFAQDTAYYLNQKNICIRAGNHCAKILEEEIKVKNTCRISLYFYNTKEEIDKLVNALNNKNILEDSLR